MRWILILKLPGLVEPLFFAREDRAMLIGDESANAGFDLFDDELINEKRLNGNLHASDYITDIREYDVPYHVRVAVDKGQ